MKKTVLITGASSGIGEATVELLLKQGYNVYAAARRTDRMLGLESKGAKILKLDVTDNDSIESVVDQINREAGGIDILINNAGYGSLGSLEEVNIDEARRQFDVNVFGLARLIQLVLPNMRNKGAGKIVNISSIGAKIYQPLGGWYHSTKFAVEGLSDCLRLELKAFGIDVILVEPGPIRTEWGNIALENLMNNSAQGPYRSLANAMERNFKTFYSEKRASGPEAVATIILKAIQAAKPNTRYVAGKGSKAILFGRKILSDKLFDKVMLTMLR